jgi:hypothetical protein
MKSETPREVVDRALARRRAEGAAPGVLADAARWLAETNEFWERLPAERFAPGIEPLLPEPAATPPGTAEVVARALLRILAERYGADLAEVLDLAREIAAETYPPGFPADEDEETALAAVRDHYGNDGRDPDAGLGRVRPDLPEMLAEVERRLARDEDDALADYDATMAEADATARATAAALASGAVRIGDVGSDVLGDLAGLPETGAELLRAVVAELRLRVAW